MIDNAPQDDPEYRTARKYVKSLRRFYCHLTTYIAVIALLSLLNYLSAPGHWWVQWVAFGWGIGVASQALSLLVSRGFFSSDWEEREIQKILARQRNG